jgi:sarcosine oxidase
MRIVVVGAGAWGLPAGAELARRGHAVTVVDAFGVVNRYSSSSGATRLWRLAHPDPADVRLALESVQAWRRLEQRCDRDLLLTRGLLWRDADAGAVAAVLVDQDVKRVEVDAADVGRFFPGMVPNGLDAVWQPEAGPVLAEAALLAQTELLEAAGGRLLTGWMVTGLQTRLQTGSQAGSDAGSDGVRLLLGDPDQATGAAPGEAGDPAVLEAEAVVVAAGPWAQPLLDGLGLPITLRPQLGQVTHLTGRDGWQQLPCALDGYHHGAGGYYAMPTPGQGYKLGFSEPVRRFDPADRDRQPDPGQRTALVARAADLGFDRPVPGLSQVCTWTDSPDGEFVIDRLAGGRVVLAVGDSGHGFKFSAVMGEWLADLVEGGAIPADLCRFSAARFQP